MTYLQTEHQVRGKQREPIIMRGVLKSLRKNGYPDAQVIESSLNENMSKKIDYKILPGKYEMFRSLFMIPVDIKSGWSFTLYTSNGINTLERSKSAYLIYEYEESDDEYVFIKVDTLRDLVKKYPPKLRNSKFNSSKYFSMVDYVFENMEHFDDNDYFEVPKV